MNCHNCGVKGDVISGLCINCYVDSHLPSKKQDSYWIYMWKSVKRGFVAENSDNKLHKAITSLGSRVTPDKSHIILRVGGEEITIPAEVERVDEVALKSRILVGKWLIRRSRSEIDIAWKTVAKEVYHGKLGSLAKVSTPREGERQHVICVYTDNYFDLEDVMRVRERLRELRFTGKLCYKPDIYTYLGIYRGTTKLSPCRYQD